MSCCTRKETLLALNTDDICVTASKEQQKLDRLLHEISIKKASLEDVIEFIKRKGLEDEEVKEHFQSRQMLKLPNKLKTVKKQQFDFLYHAVMFGDYLIDLGFIEYFEKSIERIRDDWGEVPQGCINNFFEQVVHATRVQWSTIQLLLRKYLSSKYPDTFGLRSDNMLEVYDKTGEMAHLDNEDAIRATLLTTFHSKRRKIGLSTRLWLI